MSMRVLSCVAATLLGADLALAAHPGKVDMHHQKVDEPKTEERTGNEAENGYANMAEAEVPEKPAPVKPAAQVQKKAKTQQQGQLQAAQDPEEGQDANTTAAGTTAALSADGLFGFHLAALTTTPCDFGVTVTEIECWNKGKAILADMKIKPGRSYLVAGSMATAPPGCSIHSNMDWAVTYNTNVAGTNDGNFREICHGKSSEVHSVKEGENQCDFGKDVKAEKCLAAINSIIKVVAGDSAADQSGLHLGHWDTTPPGCSMHIGAGSNTATSNSVAYFNTKTDATNDGSFVLVCTGTVVQIR